jgi:3',5'-cyclic AMP phosphodiesterase CpdA
MKPGVKTLSFTTAADTAMTLPSYTWVMFRKDMRSGVICMVEEIYKENPEIRFALLGGDLTNHGEDVNEWGEFLSAAAGVFSQIPMMPAKGNHDGNPFLDFFALPENGPQGVMGSCFYSFDYGDAHFVILDSSNIITDSVKQWLQQDLQNTNKKWKFAVFHHPPYQNFDDNKTIDDALREHWVPIWSKTR